MKLKIVLSILAAILFSCKSNNTASDFDYGRIENNVYENSYFGFTLPIPDNWVVQSKEETDSLQKTGGRMLAGENKNFKARIRASEIKSSTLISLFEFENGSPVDFNPNLAIIAENIQGSPGIKTGKDYLFQVKKLLKESSMQYEFKEDTYLTKVGNQDFYCMDVEFPINENTSVYQKYFSTIIKTFSLNIVATYDVDSNESKLMDVLNKMNFME